MTKHRMTSALLRASAWLAMFAAGCTGTEVGNPVMMDVQLRTPLPSEVSLEPQQAASEDTAVEGRFVLSNAELRLGELQYWHGDDCEGTEDNGDANRPPSGRMRLEGEEGRSDFADGRVRSFHIRLPVGDYCQLAFVPGITDRESVYLDYRGALSGRATATETTSWVLGSAPGDRAFSIDPVATEGRRRDEKSQSLFVAIDAGIWLAEALRASRAAEGGVPRFGAKQLEDGLMLFETDPDASGSTANVAARSPREREKFLAVERAGTGPLDALDDTMPRHFFRASLEGAVSGELESQTGTDRIRVVPSSETGNGGPTIEVEDSARELTIVLSLNAPLEVDPTSTQSASVRVRDLRSSREWQSAEQQCALSVTRMTTIGNPLPATRLYEGRGHCLSNLGGRLLPRDGSSDGVIEIVGPFFFRIPLDSIQEQ